MPTKKLLLVFDGGDAPGYMSVATALTEVGTERGWEVFAAAEGYRSLVGAGCSRGPNVLRLCWEVRDAWKLGRDGDAAVAMHRSISEPGCRFRSERFKTMPDPANVDAAARFILDGSYDYFVAVGGNGTFAATRSVVARMKELTADGSKKAPRSGFINVSVDSDILNDTSVGFATGIEKGAEIARGLYEDAFTHQRIYVLEMMGNRSGKHTLHSSTVARAHLIVLPDFHLDERILCDVANALAEQRYGLVTVAEGYERDLQKKRGHPGAAHLLRQQLVDAGLEDRDTRRVVAEPFSRYLRGVRPNARDIELAVVKSRVLVEGLASGEDAVMAFFLSEHDFGLMPFAKAETDNSVERAYFDLIDRLNVFSFRSYVAETFRGYCIWPPESVGRR